MGKAYKNKHSDESVGNGKNRVNGQITASVVQLISPDGRAVGVTPLDMARSLAEELELDLVELNANAQPPVVKITDYSKMQYREQQREKKARAVKASHDLKEVRIRPKTGEHDLDTKAKAAVKFLTKGHPLKITVLMKGRENARRDESRELLEQFTSRLSDYGDVTGRITSGPSSMSIMMQPK